jgi:hypothetical protein
MELWEENCDCCGPQRNGWYAATFMEGEECDPDHYQASIQLNQLQFGVDYTITSYP